MSKRINDGGPAFPHGQQTILEDTYSGSKQDLSEDFDPGMTLRQWYAGQAMMGLNANPEFRELSVENIASWAFQQADAMIAHEAKTREVQQ